MDHGGSVPDGGAGRPLGAQAAEQGARTRHAAHGAGKSGGPTNPSGGGAGWAPRVGAPAERGALGEGGGLLRGGSGRVLAAMATLGVREARRRRLGVEDLCASEDMWMVAP
jgi:hypothetical protein